MTRMVYRPRRRLTSALLGAVMLLALAACQGRQAAAPEAGVRAEDLEAKQLLQGTWADELTGEVLFVALGDTLYYADATSLPACFSIVDDSLLLPGGAYHIERQGEHLFWFENQAGDVVKLVRVEDDDANVDVTPQPVTAEVPPEVTEVVNRDSVVIVGGDRYHWYVTINPTRNRVVRTTYNADGLSVQKVYYDNIIHIGFFQDGRRLFSRDYRKQMFAGDVPERFLNEAVLGNIEYDHADAEGFHFNATLCIPDEASCYMVEIVVGRDGEAAMRLLEF